MQTYYKDLIEAAAGGLSEFAFGSAENERWETSTREQMEEIDAVVRLAVELDDYLRAIRSEELDGSEPALGELLERSSAMLQSIVARVTELKD